MFSKFSRFLSKGLGSSIASLFIFLIIVIWFVSGPFFDFSERWQLIINSISSVLTLLMVFLIHNTQNRDTVAIQLKLDELIRAMQGTHHELLKSEELSDKELEILLKRYENLAEQIKKRMKKGKGDLGKI